MVSAGAAIAGAATYARQKTHEATGTDPVAVLPESAQQAIDGEVTSGSTSRSLNVSSENQQPNRSGQSISDTVAGGAAAVGSAAASAATYARQKTYETTGTDPVSVLPTSAQQSIDGDAISTSTRGFASGQGSSGQGITDSPAAGASSASTTAANAATYAREKTHQTTGTDPVSMLPTVIQKNIDGHSGTNSGLGASFPRVVGEPVVRSHSSGIDLHSGVHNGVVGDHLDDESRSSLRPASGSHSGHWQPGSSATVAHVPSLRDVDLSAGVKNTVVGSGAEGNNDGPQ